MPDMQPPPTFLQPIDSSLTELLHANLNHIDQQLDSPIKPLSVKHGLTGILYHLIGMVSFTRRHSPTSLSLAKRWVIDYTHLRVSFELTTPTSDAPITHLSKFAIGIYSSFDKFRDTITIINA